MLRDIHAALAEERARELRRSLPAYRGTKSPPPPLLKIRVGRGLIYMGAWLAGEDALFERLFAARR